VARGLGGTWAGAIVVGCVTAIALTADRLPARVASHFAADGLANGFMTRQGYLLLMLAITAITAGLPAYLIGVAVRRTPMKLNIPNKAYWLAPERRLETAEFMIGHATALAAGLAIFLLGMHLLLIRANHLSPPHLELAPFAALMLGFGVAMAAWIARLHRRFRLGPGTDA
jgi:serine/threonine-protein kinase